MEDLKTYLMVEARKKGICEEGFSQMRVDSLQALVDYYLANPDWCLERDYPALQVLKDRFANLEHKGIFVGRKFNGELLNDLQVYVFHNCSGTIKVGLNVDKKIIPMLYVANGCRLRFQGVGDFAPRRKEDRSHIPVYSFGRNDITAKDNKWVRFLLFRHKML